MNATQKQRGVALLVVLILLVMMSALAAKISQQFCRNLQKTRYQVSQQQLRWAMQSQEMAIKTRLQEATVGEKNVLTLEGEWHTPLETQGENYTVVSQVEDAQDCFNVNNLLATAAEAEPKAGQAAATPVPEKPYPQQVIEQIFTDSGISATTAETLYRQLMDDLDEDSTTEKGGQEKDSWAGVQPARQPANQMMITLSELKQLPAFPPSAWPKLSVLLCALPTTHSQLNVNTLTSQKAALLAALFPGKLTAEEAGRIIDARPEGGWESVEAFSEMLERSAPQLKDDLKQVTEQLAVTSRYFQVNYTGNTDELTLRVTSQMRATSEAGEVQTWQRRYRLIE